MAMSATQQGMIFGTAAYMSPEQASGEVVDKRADIWSFGVVLFEMLTGRRMFTGKSVSHVLANVLKSDPDWKSLPSNLHPRARLLLERCLEKEPRDRYHDIAEARVDLEHVLADPRGVLIQPADTASGAKPASFRFVAIAVVAAAAVAGTLGWLLHRAPERAPGPVVRFPMFLPPSVLFTLTPASMLAISPDGARVAYTANGQVFLRNLNESEGRPVPGTNVGGAGPASPVFSPDGLWLAYVHVLSSTGPFAIHRVPITGGTPLKIFESQAGLGNYQWGLTWPTTDKMVFANGDGILRISANGGTPEVLIKRVEGEAFDSPQILPGGKQVLFVRAAGPVGELNASRWETADIVIQTIGGNDRTVLWKGGSHPRYLPTGNLIYAQGNSLFALSVDLNSRKVTGGPVPILEGVKRSSNGITDAAQYAVSDSGTLVTIPGEAGVVIEKGILTLQDRKGIATPLAVRPAQYRGPRLSPNGQYLAVEILDGNDASNIWIYDLSGKSEIRRLTQTGKHNKRPIWTPDSRKVAFESDRDGDWGIYEQPADGSILPIRLTTGKNKGEQYPESWSPDNKTLTFVEVPTNSDWDIWSFSRDSGATALIAGGNGNQFGSVFSPDGKWIAYTDNASNFGIRVQPFPVTGVVRQITQDGEAWPVWTKSGEMFFRLRRDTGKPNELRALDVTTTGEFAFKNPRTLQLPANTLMYQSYRDFDVTPNGDKFVVIVAEQKDAKAGAPAPALRIDVVLNWFEELKARVKVP
jgi:serine/threonine-protein kinase